MRTLLLIATFFALTNLTAQVQIIAHRGASHIAPENTLASVKLGYELNADAVEIDIYLSADNEVMVHHDKTTKRTSGGKTNYNISKTAADTLHSIDVGTWKHEKYATERLPYLRDVLALVPEGKRLIIEIKCGTEVIPALIQVVEESGKMTQCDFISFGWKTISEVHAAFPENDCYYIKVKTWRIKGLINKTSEAGLAGLTLHHKRVNKRVIRLAKQADVAIYCWTVDKSEDFQRMEKLGVIGITTNRPDLFVGN